MADKVLLNNFYSNFNYFKLFKVSKYWLLQELQIWFFCRFSDLRFVNLKELMEADLPLLPSEFESLIKKQCWDAHEVLRKK